MSGRAAEASRARVRKKPDGNRPAAGSWKKDPDARRRRVLDEATALFATRGFARVSTGDIARAAGVSEGSVFHYFGSKQQLLRAVGERYGVEFAAAMFDGVEAVPSRETVREVVGRAFGFVEKSWPGFGLFLLSDDPSSAPLAQKANREAVTRAVEAVLETWSASGVIDGVDAEVVADLLFGLVEAALRACFAGRAAAGRVRYEAATVAAICEILGLERGNGGS